MWAVFKWQVCQTARRTQVRINELPLHDYDQLTKTRMTFGLSYKKRISKQPNSIETFILVFCLTMFSHSYIYVCLCMSTFDMQMRLLTSSQNLVSNKRSNTSREHFNNNKKLNHLAMLRLPGCYKICIALSNQLYISTIDIHSRVMSFRLLPSSLDCKFTYAQTA